MGYMSWRQIMLKPLRIRLQGGYPALWFRWGADCPTGDAKDGDRSGER